MSLKDVLDAPERNGEHNDCAVVATANVLGTTYKDAHALLAAYGRRRRHGTKVSVSRTALQSRAEVEEVKVGFTGNLRFYSTGYMGQKPTVAQFVRTLPKTGRYWLATTSHAFAYVNGELMDNIPGSKMRARMYCCWLVKPNSLPEAPKSDLSQTDINAMWERLNALERKN